MAAGGGIGGAGRYFDRCRRFSLTLVLMDVGTPKNKWAGILMTAFAAFGGILFG
jgi:hypothetical protein